ncbi:MAG TPA: 3-hydroxyacyl-CoA dehydrogenase NAD-binding domain-containing protein, partial [Stenomitos sp.]
MEAMTLLKRPDGVAVLTFDTPDSPVNILSSRFFTDFARLLDEVERDPEITACVLASAKRDSFIAGADLQEFGGITDPEAASEISRVGHRLLDRIEASRKPFVAAIHGPALGGGLEVALACQYRLASDSPKTVLGLPEVMLGLLPAGGGTQRLPRLIGLERALPMLLTGQRLRAKKAYKYGLVDALTSPYGLVETAARAALMLAAGTLKPNRDKKPPSERLLGFGPARALALSKARDEVMRKTRGLYPAPLAILECVTAGLDHGFKAGAAKEHELFGKLVVSPEAKHLLWIFQATNELKKLPAEPAPHPVRKLAVLGAGLMGEGIAAVSMGLNPVVLKDLSGDSPAKAAKNVYKSLDKRVRSGSLTDVERSRQWYHLQFTTDPRAIAGADLVIEAVFEKLDLKRQVLAETEAILSPEAVFASNTSALPISRIAAEARYPERVLGMHYFSPVPKMPLLELVVTPKTAEWAVATAQAYGIAQGKTVIVVQDGPGFYTTRILAPYLNEAMRLLEEGAEIRALDTALKDFGFPVGPVALVDEVGIDVGAHVARDLGKAFESRGLGASDTCVKVYEAGYLGRKNGKGFYRYEATAGKGGKEVNTDIYAFFGGPERKAIPTQDMVDRLVLLMLNEAAYCLQEGIIASARDGDIGAIMGL